MCSLATHCDIRRSRRMAAPLSSAMSSPSGTKTTGHLPKPLDQLYHGAAVCLCDIAQQDEVQSTKRGSFWKSFCKQQAIYCVLRCLLTLLCLHRDAVLGNVVGWWCFGVPLQMPPTQSKLASICAWMTIWMVFTVQKVLFTAEAGMTRGIHPISPFISKY